MLCVGDMRGTAGRGRFGYEEITFVAAFVVLLASTGGGRGEVVEEEAAAVVERRIGCTATDIFYHRSTAAGATTGGGEGEEVGEEGFDGQYPPLFLGAGE